MKVDYGLVLENTKLFREINGLLKIYENRIY